MATKCETWASEIVAAKSKTAALKSAFDTTSAAAVGYMNGFHNGFGVYNCGEDLKNEILNMKAFIQADSYNSSSFLTVPVNVVQFNSGKCKGGSTNCSKAGCQSSIASVNQSLQAFFGARAALVSNLNEINTNTNLIANDAECKAAQNAQSNQNAADQAKNRQLRNGIIWVIVVSALIATFVYLDKKYFHIFL